MSEPLPCPFCGEKPQVTAILGNASVECNGRACPVYPSVKCAARLTDEAIARWNKRAPVKLKPCAECGCDMGTSADDQYCQQHS